jgi:ribosome biogenesis GTPase A
LHIKDWLDDINKYTDDNPIRLVVGNKSDLSDKRQVSQVEINNFKQQTGINVIEASAKSSDKIYEVMETMTKMLISRKTKSRLNNKNNSDTPEHGNISLIEHSNRNNEESQDCCNFSSFI